MVLESARRLHRGQTFIPFLSCFSGHSTVEVDCDSLFQAKKFTDKINSEPSRLWNFYSEALACDPNFISSAVDVAVSLKPKVKKGALKTLLSGVENVLPEKRTIHRQAEISFPGDRTEMTVLQVDPRVAKEAGCGLRNTLHLSADWKW